MEMDTRSVDLRTSGIAFPALLSPSALEDVVTCSFCRMDMNREDEKTLGNEMLRLTKKQGGE